MATFEEREFVDYAFKKIQDILEEKDKSFIVKDLDKLFNRLRRAEESIRRIIERMKNLENRIRTLEDKEQRVRLIENSSSDE